MVSPEPSSSHPQPMTKPSFKAKASSWLTDGFLFLGGAFLALLLLITIYSFINPNPTSSPNFGRTVTTPKSDPGGYAHHTDPGPDLTSDPPDRSFYDDPELTYTIGSPVKNWDEKRTQWLMYHPSFQSGAADRILMVTGSQPSPCKNPIGDHLLLRFFKNKVDYSRIHGIDLFYNNAFMHPEMRSYWAKIPVIRAAMVAHPEVEWIWWVDSDALFTDMDFKLPLEKYTNHNLVVHGWAHLILDTHSWTGLNAGVFLIRNCEWSMRFLEAWAAMGPQTPEYEKWGETLRANFKDKAFPESDDQTGLAYLIYKENEIWADRIYLESDYYFEGYWAEIVGNYENITEKYTEIERREGDEDVARLRRRHAEKVSEGYGAFREKFLKDAGSGYGVGSWRRPFVTHFTGCQPCSGDHNQMYSGTSCWDGMQKALKFADNQVLRKYGFVHPTAVDSSIQPLPFNYPVVS